MILTIGWPWNPSYNNDAGCLGEMGAEYRNQRHLPQPQLATLGVPNENINLGELAGLAEKSDAAGLCQLIELRQLHGHPQFDFVQNRGKLGVFGLITLFAHDF